MTNQMKNMTTTSAVIVAEIFSKYGLENMNALVIA